MAAHDPSTKRLTLADLIRVASELAQDGEDADTIAASLRARFPSSAERLRWEAADTAIARRARGELAA